MFVPCPSAPQDAPDGRALTPKRPSGGEFRDGRSLVDHIRNLPNYKSGKFNSVEDEALMGYVSSHVRSASVPVLARCAIDSWHCWRAHRL